MNEITEILHCLSDLVPYDEIYYYRHICTNKVADFADNYFTELVFVSSAGVCFLIAPGHTVLGMCLRYYLREEFPVYTLEGNRVITVLGTTGTFVSASACIVNALFSSTSLSLISLVGGLVLQDTYYRFKNKYF